MITIYILDLTTFPGMILSQYHKPLQSPWSELQEHAVCFKSVTSDMIRGGCSKDLSF